MAVPKTQHYRTALDKGDTLAYRPHLHWVQESKLNWVRAQKRSGKRIVAVELTDDAILLSFLEPAAESTIVLLGHEAAGVPPEVLALVDQTVQIPMVGVGVSLNVAVAGSLVAYRLAGLS